MSNTAIFFSPQQPPTSAANQLPEPRVEDHRLPEPGPSSHDFARNLIWTFEDLRMLVGSDMPIFGDSGRPFSSLV